MLSKFIKPCYTRPLLACKLKHIRSQPTRCSVFGHTNRILLASRLKKSILLYYQPIRRAGEMVPPTQYDSKMPIRCNIWYVLRVYWETIPLFLVTCTSFSICVLSILWAINNKVDTVFTTHSRQNISRTMDLRNPTIHKIFIINEHYRKILSTPWPEMQDVLDKMAMAEKRALVKLQSCM